MVITGSVLIVESDPVVASIWVEVAAFAGFAAEVVSQVPDLRSKPDISALLVRVSPESRPVVVDRPAPHRPRLIALTTAGSDNGDLTEFDVVLPGDGQVHALYAELRRLAADGPTPAP
jgi:hypothetical protein